MKSDRRIYIFDTTLRDGQQCPGAGMSFERNLEYARLAADAGVDVLEAGFPSASKVDFDIVHTIADELGREAEAPTIAGLCQLREEQIDKTIEALLPAVRFNKARLHVYVPVAPELMRASLGDKAENKKQIVADVRNFVHRAVQAGCEVEFSPEGYSRQGENFNFTTDLIRAAVDSGALVINCPDTIGGACRLEGKKYFVEKMKEHAAIIAREFPNRTVIWSVHCHNDFGLAVENSLNGVFFGPARQIEGCFNGVGERAGNAALEQCIMIIKHFAHHLDHSEPFHTRANTENLGRVCDFVSTNMLPCQPHWPISGSNSAKHSSGGHTNAVLKDPLAYQPFDPKEVGKDISLVFGPLSGGNHAKAIIEKAGYRCGDEEKAEIAQFIKDAFADRRKGITDDELIRGYIRFRSPVKVENFDYSKSANKSAVHLEGRVFEESGQISESYEGRDSALAALKKLMDKKMPGFEIVSHKSISDGESIHARSISTIVITDKERLMFEGVGEDQDIEISAMKALIAAINNAYVHNNFRI